MITFSEFLAEARMAPLYHGTTFKNFQIIMKEGIAPRTSHRNYKLLLRNKEESTYGISATRQFKIADRFGFVVIELDQQKISQNYKIIPIQYFRSHGVARATEFLGKYKGSTNEYEEFIITKDNLPVKYFKRIYIDDKGMLRRSSHMASFIKDLQAKYGETFVVITK